MFKEKFRSLCEEAAGKIENFGTEFSEEKKHAVFSIYLRLVKLELVFKRHSLGDVKNVLFCRFYPDKSAEAYYFFPEIFVELDIAEFRSTFFSMIENEERLENCFGALWSMIAQYIPIIEQAASEDRLPLERKVDAADPNEYLERKSAFPANPHYSREPFVILDYTRGAANRALLNGKTGKAIKLLEKWRAKGKTLEYQNRLCDYLKTHGEFSPMSESCNALKADDEAGKSAFWIYALLLVAVFAALAAVFIAAKLVFDLVHTRGTVAAFDAPWYYSVLLAVFPALPGMIVFRKPLVKLLFKKHANKLIERDELRYGSGENKFFRSIFIAFTVFSVFMFVMLFSQTVRVYEDRLDAPSEGNPLVRTEYRFSEIKEVCHIGARHNNYGERVERSSCVVVMNDGRRLDLDGYASEKQTEEELLKLLGGIIVRECDSDREI